MLVKFTNENIGNIVDAILGYGTNVTITINQKDVMIEAAELRNVAPSILAAINNQRLTFHVDGKEMTYLVDPKFRRTLRWLLYSNE